MDARSQRRCAAWLVALSTLYALAFVPPNLTGSDDASMLAAFELDEFGQYKVLWRMTAGGDADSGALRRFVCYDHYYYGFPFFFTSALVFWPLKLAFVASGAPGLTQVSMLLLRQLSALWMLAAILALVFAWTRFRDPVRSVALFSFLALLPAVVQNNLWWHPDGLATLCIVVAIVALAEDRRRLGAWFGVSAICCGLAAGTKLIGFWFFAAVAIHLAMQRPQRSRGELCRHGARYVALMAVAIVASNPHLLVASEARETLSILANQAALNASGWEVRGEAGIAAWYARALRAGFGFWWLYACMLGACIATLRFDREHRDLALAILAWVVPISIYLVFGTAKTVERYFLPVLVPMASCLASPAPWRWLGSATRRPARLAIASAFAAAIAYQLAVFAREDVARYRRVLTREQTSPALAFARELERDVLSRWAPGARIRVFRDATLYLPPRPEYEVHLRWRSPDHTDLAEIQPDLVLLRRAQIDLYGEASIAEQSFDPEQAARSQRFYRDVSRDQVPGYRTLLRTDFGVALVREAPADD